MADPNTRPGPSVFVKGFLPGLVVGLLVGLAVGVVVPELQKMREQEAVPSRSAGSGTHATAPGARQDRDTPPTGLTKTAPSEPTPKDAPPLPAPTPKPPEPKPVDPKATEPKPAPKP